MSEGPADDPDHYEYQHLRPVLVDKVAPAQFLKHEEDCLLVRVDSERNLWDVEIDGTVYVTFDGDDVSTTAQLGVYLDDLYEKALEFEQEDDQEEDLEPEESGDSFSSPAFR